MNKSPAFQFYAADFLVGTMGMSDEEVGMYIKMLAIQWERGSLPRASDEIKSLIGSKRIPSPIVMAKFTPSGDGSLRNPRLEKERKKQKAFRKSRSENAKKRWENVHSTSNARASSVHRRSNALQSSSSSSDNTIEHTHTAREGIEGHRPPPSLDVVKSASSNAGIPPNVAEKFFHEAESRVYAASGMWTDIRGKEMGNWQSALKAFWIGWQQSEKKGQNGKAQRRTEADRDRDRTGGVSTAGDGLRTL